MKLFHPARVRSDLPFPWSSDTTLFVFFSFSLPFCVWAMGQSVMGKGQRAKGNGQWAMGGKYCITHKHQHKHPQTNKQTLQSLFCTFTTSSPTLPYSHPLTTPREVWCSVTKPRKSQRVTQCVCVFPMDFWPTHTSKCGFFVGRQAGGRSMLSLFSFSSFDGRTGLVQHWV